MNSDIRIAVSFRGHRKRKRLRLSLGANATDYLLDLWIGAALNHPSGILQGMDEIDIALESGWEEEPHRFVSALIECGFLEKNELGIYVLHDWEDHQGYVVHAESRREKAKKAATKRWQNRNTHSMPQACCPDHIHMLLEIPPKMSVSGFMGYLKGKSSLMIYDQFGELKFKYRNREFWCRGYYVDTVGKNKAKIQDYIKHQLSEDKMGDQLKLPYPGNPFTGRK